MYAIIKSGGKQYRVAVNDVVDVELLEADLGSQVEFNALFVQNGEDALIGAPMVSGYVVQGELVDIIGGPKVVSVKYKRRKRQVRKFGHRQHYSRVKITAIAQA